MLVFDAVTPERPPRHTWTQGEGWVCCVDGRPYADAGTYLRAISVFRGTGDGYRRSDELHRVWTYDPDDALADLRAAGFEARRLDGFGDGVRFEPGQAGFAAVKPG